MVARADLAASMAQRLVQAAVDEAARQGWRIAAVAADAGGLPLALLRMNGVNEVFLTAATDKAWTAASFRRSTEALRERMSAEELRAGAASRARMLLWGGGLPILVDGACIGALGVSGGLVAQDIACAEAALAACGLT
ncbi:MAG: heme-binding protein [Rhodobacteraceae bacterium]|jgi:uncharacterized protein GlcG (DUF336 family)|nr:heme-binding protein [Paracoccaceae bacterium]